ncbi:ATP-binding protein, partial [uncultured Muribaculum sp.]
LVNQLLDFKKVEQNGFTVQFSRQNVTNLVTAVAERFAPSIEQMGGKLVVEQCERDIEADVDAEALTKLVSNLLNNARKYMKDRIVIACHADEGQGWFTISVSDNGVGISRDNQEKIFKPFFQVMDDNRESKGGTGLGLSIVQSVVEAHKGEIKVESSLGNGATFIVTLPLRQEGVTASAGNDIMSPAEDKGCSRAIDGGVNDVSRPVMLIVDDNEEMLQFITSNFNSDYEVVTAVNGKEALDKLSRHEVALIVSDWMMPVMNGVELCRAVRSNCNYSHIPFILLTAKTDNYSKIEGLNCGADAYVEKPFSVNYLEARIHNLVEMRKLLREKFSQTPLEPINTIAPNPVDDQFLTQLTNIIEENFSNPELSVDFLANRMGISRSGLYAKIKTLANVTPNELIQLTRLKKAAKLLAENKYRINEICYMVGFNSSSYFSKCFQRQFGIKPGEFTPHSL